MNLASGTRSSLIDLIDLISVVFGMPVDLKHVAGRRGDVRDSHASPERLRTLFDGVVPVTLRDGLSETVDWFRALQG